MDIRTLTSDYSVSPQISPQDMEAIAQAGFKSVICNRPDSENLPELHIEEMQKSAKAAGVSFYLNPFASPMMSMEHVAEQARLLATIEGPVLAYCASGTRSCRVWALSQAGQIPVEDIINAAADAGYQISDLHPHLTTLANS